MARKFESLLKLFKTLLLIVFATICTNGHCFARHHSVMVRDVFSVPSLTIDNTTISPFFENGEVQYYTIAGSGLSPNQTITIQVDDPTAFAISLGGEFASTQYINTNGSGQLEQDMIYVRFTPPDGAPYTAAISHSSPEITTQILNVEGNPSPMAVELASFTVKHLGEVIELNWVSNSDIDFSHFELEMMAEGESDFSKIGRIPSRAGEFERNYSFQYRPENAFQRFYFRLKLVDYNGKFSYSDIIATQDKSGDSRLFAFPNPITGTTPLTVWVGGEGTLNLSISDLNGIKVMKKTYEIEAGVEHVEVDVQKITTPGIYYLYTELNGNINSIKIIKENW